MFFLKKAISILALTSAVVMIYAGPSATGDFDGDGFADVANGVPGEEVGGVENAGAVSVIYGSEIDGLATRNQFWHQDSPDIRGICEPNDYFGTAVAVGDFDGDGYDDLAVGAHFEAIGELTAAGSVNVIYGTSTGLQSANNQIWYQDRGGIIGMSESGDFFGHSVAAGDFNGDGYDDLAIGVPEEKIGSDDSRSAAGGVNIIYGSINGLSASGNQFWSQDSAGILDNCEKNDSFGFSLTAGNFDGDSDGCDDLAIGVPREDNVLNNDGGVHILYGQVGTGLVASGNQYFSQAMRSISGTAGIDELYGWKLAAGDFDNDGKDDLAVGAFSDIINNQTGAGSVNILYGGRYGIVTAGNILLSQGTNGMLDSADFGDHFSSDLCTGDFNRDGCDDLAIGVSGEAKLLSVNVGGVHIVLGSASGIITNGNQFFTQDSWDMVGEGNETDKFGEYVSAGDFDGDGYVDLAVGIPYEEVRPYVYAGALSILKGYNYGITAWNNKLITQDSPGMLDQAELDDKF